MNDLGGNGESKISYSRDPLGHGLEILRWMASQDEAHFGVRRIASELDMVPSTVSRLLLRMASERVVKRDEATGEYGLGLELIRLGLLASRKLDVKRVAHTYLEQLTAASGETSILGIYDPERMEMLRVDKVDSQHPLAYTVKLDEWTEIYRGASGLGILAFLPPAEREQIMAAAKSAGTVDETWLLPERLERQLEQIRRSGYACTHGRRLHGAVAVSAPIVSLGGVVVGDLIITVPEVRWAQHQERELAELVMTAARNVSHEIGGSDADIELARKR